MVARFARNVVKWATCNAVFFFSKSIHINKSYPSCIRSSFCVVQQKSKALQKKKKKKKKRGRKQKWGEKGRKCIIYAELESQKWIFFSFFFLYILLQVFLGMMFVWLYPHLVYVIVFLTTDIVSKSPWMSHLNFSIWAFFTNFCP